MLTIRRLCAIWSQKSGYVEAYFWIELVHWTLDLASTIVFLVFAYRKKDALAQTICASDTNQQLCLNLFNGKLIVLTCGLCIYKALGVCKHAFCEKLFRARSHVLQMHGTFSSFIERR